MNFEQVDEFKKELKALKKRWRTLEADLERAKPAILSLYTPVEGVDLELYRSQFFGSSMATIITSTDTVEVIKIRLDSDSPGAKGKLRLIFVAAVSQKKVVFIELFSKNDKSREDAQRIKRYI